MSEYEPLTAALALWFDRPFTRLPRKLQRRVEKVFPIPWVMLSPPRRRMEAGRVDWEHHPALRQGHQAWWDKHCEIDKCERTASDVPIERRTAADVDLQERKLSELRKELAAIEAILDQTVKNLGLVWPGAPDAPAKVATKDHPVRTFTPREWFEASVGDQGIPGSASSRIAARHDRAARMGDAPISLNDLPAWWTLHQSLAWIMFRNVTLVSEVAAIGSRQFAATLARAEHQDRLPLSIPTVYRAEEQFLVRARAVDIQARGRIADREGYQPMGPLDWVDGKLSEERDLPVVRPARADGKFWYDIMVPKDVMVSIWPPARDQIPNSGEGPLAAPVISAYRTDAPMPEQAGDGAKATAAILIENPTVSKEPTRRAVGRPNAKNTSESLYKQRRDDGCPLGKNQLAEADGIIAMWPTDGPPRPRPKTVSGHISSLWSASHKSRDKL